MIEQEANNRFGSQQDRSSYVFRSYTNALGQKVGDHTLVSAVDSEFQSVSGLLQRARACTRIAESRERFCGRGKIAICCCVTEVGDELQVLRAHFLVVLKGSLIDDVKIKGLQDVHSERVEDTGSGEVGWNAIM